MAPEDSDGNQRIMGPAVTMGGYEKGSCPVIYPKVPEVHRAIGYIRAIACRSIANGHPDGTFRPELKVNRAQMAVFVSRTFLGLDEQG